MTRTPTRRTFRLVIALATTVLGGFLAWFVLALWLFVLPQQEPLREADAIVSLSPASVRLPSAEQAFNDGLATHLWVSHYPSDTAKPTSVATEICSPDSPDADRTICFTPTTDNTLGEARTVARLAQQVDVSSVIVATHTTHAARTRMLFEACLPEGTDVQMLLVEEPPSRRLLIERMLYETAAIAKDFVRAELLGC